jgi:uncharacterized repeat protein (TIGR03803 family)
MIGRRLITSGALVVAALVVMLFIAAGPAHAQTETVLYSFCSQPDCSDGFFPESGLTFDGAGNLYGTTTSGGTGIGGTVFELSPNGGGWSETVLHDFCPQRPCLDGEYPLAAKLIFDSAGNLYGTTDEGGANGLGTVYELSPAAGSWTENVLYSFCSQPNCADGEYPFGGVIMDSAGNLYGTTTVVSRVYELSPNGSGGWTEQGIGGGCIQAPAGLSMDASGNIFGVGCYVVFELSPNGSGGWKETTVHIFNGGPKDGSGPYGTPVFDDAGNLYGTTRWGGVNNYGIVWKLIPKTKGKRKGQWKEKILHTFKGGTKDGASPWAGVTLDSSGNLYGTTSVGGKYGDGTVFELTPNGESGYGYKVLWSFNGADGDQPFNGLTLDSAGNLYGTTFYGGSGGVVFEVTP